MNAWGVGTENIMWHINKHGEVFLFSICLYTCSSTSEHKFSKFYHMANQPSSFPIPRIHTRFLFILATLCSINMKLFNFSWKYCLKQKLTGSTRQQRLAFYKFICLQEVNNSKYCTKTKQLLHGHLTPKYIDTCWIKTVLHVTMKQIVSILAHW